MDVACGRCQSEYEFDDALISEEGTAVRCTSCGHQFRVFPRAGAQVVERWLLWRAGVADPVPVVFDSLRALQRAIHHGEVERDDLLARGDEVPRMLSTIVELAPLFSQPRSVSPPGRNGSELPPAVVESDEPPADGLAALSRTGSGTVLGLAAPPVPRVELLAPPREEPEAAEGDDPSPMIHGEAYVPASDSGPEELELNPTHQTPGSPRPRVVSMLSSPERSVASDRSGGAVVPGPPLSSRPPAAARTAPSGLAPGGAPRILERVSPPDGLTPTPPLSGRFSLVDSGPISAIPGTDRGRRARGVWLLLVVLGGAGGFVLLTAKDKIPFLGGEWNSAKGGPRVADQKDVLTHAAQAEANAEEAWLRLRLADAADQPFLQEVLKLRLQAFESLLAPLTDEQLPVQQRPQFRTLTVHLRRMQGDLNGARAAVASADGQALSDPYVLAMVDLAEADVDRPYSIILARLKEASTGERGQFLIRSAYIYAQILAGRLEQARADLAVLSQLKGGQVAPLYADLEQFLGRAVQTRQEASVTEPAPPSGAQPGGGKPGVGKSGVPQGRESSATDAQREKRERQ